MGPSNNLATCGQCRQRALWALPLLRFPQPVSWGAPITGFENCIALERFWYPAVHKPAGLLLTKHDDPTQVARDHGLLPA